MTHEDAIRVTNVDVLENPATLQDPFKFEITFECAEELAADLEWRLTYIGSVESESYDQILDSILVGPIPKGTNRFIFETPGPDYKQIPKSQILGLTAIFLSCLFDDKEFLRIGYYVNNEYNDPNAIYPEVQKPESGEAQEDKLDEEDILEDDEIDVDGDEEVEESEEDDSNFIDRRDDASLKEQVTEPPSKKAKNEVASPSENKENSQPASSLKNYVKEAKPDSSVKDPSVVPENDEEMRKKKLEEKIPFPLNFDVTKVTRTILKEPRVTRIHTTK